SDLEVARALSRAAAERGRKLRVHVKVDTGMGRLGLRPPDVVPFLHALRDLGGLKVEGVFTHLATADEADKSYARQQYEAFLWTKEQIRAAGLDVPFYHCANSAALLDLPEMAEGMVRPGIALYGCYPSPQVQRRVELKPAMQLKARVAAVKRLPAGSSVSYGRTYTLTREAEVALLPLGYADGFSRLLSNRAQVLVGGRRVPQIGRVCMDQCMVELPPGMEVRPGQEAVLFGRQGEETISVEEVAERLGTISYEVVCLVSARVPRVYLRGGRAVEVWEADWRPRAARLGEGE
ncbi:MAG: alanine racemase, partial [Bacillota bacterium]|nr:alanine racemase [Bacillota bacterium]